MVKRIWFAVLLIALVAGMSQAPVANATPRAADEYDCPDPNAGVGDDDAPSIEAGRRTQIETPRVDPHVRVATKRADMFQRVRESVFWRAVHLAMRLRGWQVDRQ